MMINLFKRLFAPRPYNQGFLPEKDGHLVFFSEYGNPQGQPVIVFHGGPGGGCKPHHTNFANLNKYRVILFDQRGCGNSLPLGKLEHNTTQDLLDDIERLLIFLKVQSPIIIRGGSWGSALALLFAEKHPQLVKKLLLSQIFLVNKDAEFLEFSGNRFFYPEFVEKLEQKSAKVDKNIPTFFMREIISDDQSQQLDAANYYGWYERICGNMEPRWNNLQQLSPQELASLRIFMHYRARNFMLTPDYIMQNISKIAAIPTVIIHNRLDFVCPYKGAYDLHKAMPNSRLITVPERGHVGKLLYKTINHEFKRELQKL